MARSGVEKDAYIPTCLGPLGKWPPSFFVFSFSSARLRAVVGLQAASVVLNRVCCLPPCKPLKHQLFLLLFQQHQLIPVSLDFSSSSFTVLKLQGKKKKQQQQPKPRQFVAVSLQAMSAASARLCFPECEIEMQKCPGLKQILISVWGVGWRVHHTYVKRCDHSFQSKYSSFSMDSVVVAILRDLMSPGDDSEKFICSWPALI